MSLSGRQKGSGGVRFDIQADDRRKSNRKILYAVSLSGKNSHKKIAFRIENSYNEITAYKK